jgi:hypothetical protein
MDGGFFFLNYGKYLLWMFTGKKAIGREHVQVGFSKVGFGTRIERVGLSFFAEIGTIGETIYVIVIVCSVICGDEE